LRGGLEPEKKGEAKLKGELDLHYAARKKGREKFDLGHHRGRRKLERERAIALSKGRGKFIHR